MRAYICCASVAWLERRRVDCDERALWRREAVPCVVMTIVCVYVWLMASENMWLGSGE